MKKPDDCTCAFPEVHSPTATGHRPNCPAHHSLLRSLGVGLGKTVRGDDDGMDDIVVGDPSITDEFLEKAGILPGKPAGVAETSKVGNPHHRDCNCWMDGRRDEPGYNCITGHMEDCPVHRECVGSNSAIGQALAMTSPLTAPPPVAQIDRGTPHWIWHGASGASFSAFAAADCRAEVSVPIGWSLRPDPREGVILVSTFGAKVEPLAALGLASFGQNGFRIRRSERIGAAHIGV